ncbi:MAG: CoA transferase [Cryobacterium sp.]|nr:CoA transferase [Cryobacterium sp.]
MPAALAGLTVIDLTSFVPGPYASMLLADLGARVIQVEPPGGDPSRSLPYRRGDDSALHAWIGRGKSSLVLDLKTTADRDRLFELVAVADIVIEGFAPGAAHRLGVDYEACQRVNPRIIYCSIAAVGDSAESVGVPGHDLDSVARAGVLDQLRDAAGSVISAGPLFGDISAGLHAAVGILAAVHYRERTGIGQRVGVSLLGGALAMAAPQLVKALAGAVPEPGKDLNLGGDPAYRAYRARDGRWFVLAGLETRFWEKVCRLLGRDELIELRQSDPSRVARELENLFATQDRDAWAALLEHEGVCFGPVNPLSEVAADARIVESGLLADSRLNSPIHLSATPPDSSRPAPSLDERLEET